MTSGLAFLKGVPNIFVSDFFANGYTNLEPRVRATPDRMPDPENIGFSVTYRKSQEIDGQTGHLPTTSGDSCAFLSSGSFGYKFDTQSDTMLM
jgi:hypothetical protein